MQYSLVNFSEIKNNLDLRIDAEYWHPSFIKNSRLVSQKHTIQDFITDNLSNIKSSPINRGFEYLEISKIPLESLSYNTTQINQGEEPDRAHYILQEKDVVVSTVRPNRNAVALIDKNGIIGSSGLCLLRTKNIEPEYLFVFCKTDYFIKCLMRANKATMYPAVSNKDILNVPFFVPSRDFRNKIKHNIQKALSCIEESRRTFKQAQGVLLSELDLTDWKPKHHLSFTRQYSDIKRAGRMDAEYFQPKYEQIIQKIKTCKGGYDTLGRLGNFKTGNFISDNFYSNSGTRFYIRIKELSLTTPLEKEKMTFIDNGFTRTRETVVKQNDFVFATIGATIGKVNIITEEFKNSFPSNNTSKYTLNQKKYPFYFECLLRSFLVQEQIKQNLTKTGQEKISNEALEKILVPILSDKIQKSIQKKIVLTTNLYKKSKKLMELSIHTVEKAIEQNEKSALHWLQSKLSKSPPH